MHCGTSFEITTKIIANLLPCWNQAFNFLRNGNNSCEVKQYVVQGNNHGVQEIQVTQSNQHLTKQ